MKKCPAQVSSRYCNLLCHLTKVTMQVRKASQEPIQKSCSSGGFDEFLYLELLRQRTERFPPSFFFFLLCCCFVFVCCLFLLTQDKLQNGIFLHLYSVTYEHFLRWIWHLGALHAMWIIKKHKPMFKSCFLACCPQEK